MVRKHSSAALTHQIPRGFTRRRTGAQRWFVCYTNPGCEKRAALCLQSRDYETYLPLVAKWEKQFKRLVRVERPLFVRYLFFALRPGQTFWGLRNAHGVESILRNGEIPMEVPSKALDDLRRAQAAGAFDETLRPASDPLMTPGARVEITLGAYASFPGIVGRVLSSETVEVLIQIFGRGMTVQVPVAGLREAC